VRHAVDHGLSAGGGAKTNGTCRWIAWAERDFTAILVAVYCVEMMRFLKAHNIGIRLPDQVPPMIKNSFDLLIPVLVVVLTLYPLSLFIQHHFDMLIPQAIMAIFKPLVSAADSCRRFCWRC
jgi:PTS system cellobiose-specific IIC component